MMSVLSYAFIWGGVLETVALECSQTRPASPIKKQYYVLCIWRGGCVRRCLHLNTEAALQI